MGFLKGESGNPHRQFRKGESGNPGGRPKSFAARIKAKCGADYEQLVDALYVLAFGSPQAIAEYFQDPDLKVDAKLRLAAIVELRDSGPGRPKTTVEIDEAPDVPLFLFAAEDMPQVHPVVPILPTRPPIAQGGRTTTTTRLADRREAVRGEALARAACLEHLRAPALGSPRVVRARRSGHDPHLRALRTRQRAAPHQQR
jgi:hypothetical protein